MIPHLLIQSVRRFRFFRLAAASLIMTIGPAFHAKAINLTPFALAMEGVTYDGIPLEYDASASGPEWIVFDAPSWARVPKLTIQNEGSLAYLFIAAANSYLVEEAWKGTNTSSLLRALNAAGFTAGRGEGNSPGTSGEEVLSPSDESNLQGVYQVGLWIFGAILMLPIVLKVRPT